MNTLRISLAAIVALLLLAGCGSLGGVLGNGNSNPTTSQSTSIQGTITNIDTRAQRIDVSVNSSSGYPSSGYTSSVYYDSRTQFSYQNRNLNPSDVRRGDQVDIRAYNNGSGRYTADTVYVINSGMASNYPGTYPSNQITDIQGTVNYVDTTAQRIDLSSSYATGLRTGGQGNYSIYYDSRTPVYYQGQTYSPTSLERGDQIDARVYDNGSGRLMTDSITVTRNVRQ